MRLPGLERLIHFRRRLRNEPAHPWRGGLGLNLDPGKDQWQHIAATHVDAQLKHLPWRPLPTSGGVLAMNGIALHLDPRGTGPAMAKLVPFGGRSVRTVPSLAARVGHSYSL